MNSPTDSTDPQTGAKSREERAHHEARSPSSRSVTFGADKPLKLDAGGELTPFTIAYETYGHLNEERSNAILVFHALTGDQYAASPFAGHRQGWLVVHHDRSRQTDRY